MQRSSFLQPFEELAIVYVLRRFAVDQWTPECEEGVMHRANCPWFAQGQPNVESKDTITFFVHLHLVAVY